MALHIIDSAIFGSAWSTEKLRAIFDDVPRTRDWLEILAVLAEVEADFALIPAEAGKGVADVCRAIAVDQRFLAEVRGGFEASNHSLVGIINAVAQRCPSGFGEWVCYGAAVQDVTDTWMGRALMRVQALIARDLEQIESNLLKLASEHRDTVMVGRTHGQCGLPITFGFKVAGWAAEVRRHRDRLNRAAQQLGVGQLCGGVGSLSALGPRALEVQEKFCVRLGLKPPLISWTNSRDSVVDYANLLALIGATADRIGHEIYNLQRFEIAEVREGSSSGAVGSITMPHKRNPEISEHLGTLARVIRHNAALLGESMVHDHERDGRSWKVEWEAVPEISAAACRLLSLLVSVTANLEVDAERMRRNLDATAGLVSSEALMLALAPKMGKQSAHELVYELGLAAQRDARPFKEIVCNSQTVREHLSAQEISDLFDYRRNAGQCSALAGRVVEELRRR
jgi:adenylosuccinate lyase